MKTINSTQILPGDTNVSEKRRALNVEWHMINRYKSY